MPIPFFPLLEYALLVDQFCDFARMIFFEDIKPRMFSDKIQNPESFYGRVPTFATLTLQDIPQTLEAFCEEFLNQPITADDRTLFCLKFKIPFQSTGKSVATLWQVNPTLFNPILDLLIQSKRLQYLGATATNVFEAIKSLIYSFHKTRDIEPYRAECNRLFAVYKQRLEQKEQEIAVAWVAAVQAEPQFLATEAGYTATVSRSQYR